MDLKPVTSYATTYPTRDAVDAQPDLLRRLPARWRRNTLVLAAIAAVGGIACAAAKEDKPISRIAPLFQLQPERGPLMGDFAAPKFLSEEEARTLIVEELKAAGITPAADAQTLKEVPIAQPAEKGQEPPVVKMPIVLDGTDAKTKIAFEYVSDEDYRTLTQRKDARFMMRDELQKAAATLRDGLVQATPAGTYGIFYDPATWDDKSAKDDLRKQVKDFIAWLKAEKVI